MKQKIVSLCEAWRAEVIQPNGNLLLSQKSEALELSYNGIQPHHLTFEQLIIYGTEISKNLLIGNMSTCITRDHYLFWAWSAGLLLDSFPAPKRTEIWEDHSIHSLLATSLSCNLGKLSITDRFITPPASTSILSSHIGFPLLEGLCRRASDEYLTRDGTVIKGFDIKDGDKVKKKYTANKRCSSLSDALHLTMEIIQPDIIKDSLRDLIKNTEKQSKKGREGHDFIFDLRNRALHGEESSATIGGTLLTAALLIGLRFVQDRYEERRDWLKCSVSFNQQGNLTPGWSHIYADYCNEIIL